MNQELRPLVIKRINKFKKFLLYLLVFNVLYQVNHRFSDIKKTGTSFFIVEDADYSEYKQPRTGILSYF